MNFCSQSLCETYFFVSYKLQTGWRQQYLFSRNIRPVRIYRSVTDIMAVNVLL